MTSPIAPAASQAGNLTDPLRAYNFKLSIGNVTGAHFTEVSGLGVRVERISYREAGSNSVVRAIPGRVAYSAVTLRYGLTGSVDMWEWLMTAVQGRVSRRNVSIIMLDPAGTREVLRWDLIDAWPEEWHGAPLDAMSRELAIETLVLAHDGLKRETANGVAPLA